MEPRRQDNATPHGDALGRGTATSSQPTTTAKANGVKLTYMSPDSQGRHEVEQAIYNDYAKNKPGISVEIVSGRQFAQPLLAEDAALHADLGVAEVAHRAGQRRTLPPERTLCRVPCHRRLGSGHKNLSGAGGVDPKAFLLMSQHTHVVAWGMSKYTGWSQVNTWLGKNFAPFDQGTQTASDYGKAATAFIDANLQQTV